MVVGGELGVYFFLRKVKVKDFDVVVWCYYIFDGNVVEFKEIGKNGVVFLWNDV